MTEREMEAPHVQGPNTSLWSLAAPERDRAERETCEPLGRPGLRARREQCPPGLWAAHTGPALLPGTCSAHLSISQPPVCPPAGAQPGG